MAKTGGIVWIAALAVAAVIVCALTRESEMGMQTLADSARPLGRVQRSGRRQESSKPPEWPARYWSVNIVFGLGQQLFSHTANLWRAIRGGGVDAIVPCLLELSRR